jgi:hypothetical protein
MVPIWMAGILMLLRTHQTHLLDDDHLYVVYLGETAADPVRMYAFDRQVG